MIFTTYHHNYFILYFIFMKHSTNNANFNKILYTQFHSMYLNILN